MDPRTAQYYASQRTLPGSGNHLEDQEDDFQPRSMFTALSNLFNQSKDDRDE